MTSIEKNKSIDKIHFNYKEVKTNNNLLKSKLNFQRHNQSDSETEQNQLLVEAIFSNQSQSINKSSRSSKFDQEDQDIKRFLEEQIPGLYNSKNVEQPLYEEQQQDNLYSYYNSSTAPQYFMMSKFQKQNFFDNLNAVYMARLSSQKITENMNSNSDTKIDKKIKPAIKFNQIVFQVPFNKQEQPTVIKDTPQEEAYITFDEEAYQCSEDSDEQSEQQVPIMESLSQARNYFDELDSQDFEQELKNKILSNICKQRLELLLPDHQSRQNDIFTESQEGSGSSDQINIKNSNSTILSSDEQQHHYKYKRGANKQFLSSSSQSESSEENSQSRQDLSDSQDQFQQFIRGRKIHPSKLYQQKLKQMAQKKQNSQENIDHLIQKNEQNNQKQISGFNKQISGFNEKTNQLNQKSDQQIEKNQDQIEKNNEQIEKIKEEIEKIIEQNEKISEQSEKNNWQNQKINQQNEKISEQIQKHNGLTYENNKQQSESQCNRLNDEKEVNEIESLILCENSASQHSRPS